MVKPQPVRLFPELCDRVPAFAEAMRRHESGDLAGARMMYANLADQPQLTAAVLHQLGLIAAAQGEHARAADLFLHVTRLAPTLWTGYANLSAALDRIGKTREATGALVDFACQLYRLRQYKEAEPIFRKVLGRDPGNYTANANLGTCVAWLNNLEEAAALLIRALRVYGRSAPEMAAFVTEMEKYLDVAYLARIAPLPDGPGPGRLERAEDALTSLGKVLCDLGYEQAAMLCHRMAVKTAPGFALAHWNYALALLTRRDFTHGWAEYDWRWNWPEFPEPNRRLPAAPWRGEDLAGKRIVIWSEQGFGDVMQFVPLVRRLADRNPAAEVMLEVPASLVRLLANSFAGIEVIKRSEQPNSINTEKKLDYALPLMSLPHRLQLEADQLPLAVNYLHPCKDDVPVWRERLQSAAGLKVGLVWATRPYPDTKRWVSLKLFRPLLATPGVSWFSLQVGGQEKEIAAEQVGGLIDLAPHLKDFADTAAAVSQLDLVITVDTAVAHLAAGLGKEVWTLVRDVADWRWASDQTVTPWYPTMRLFRQKRGGDWDEVLLRVHQALAEKSRCAGFPKVDGQENDGRA